MNRSVEMPVADDPLIERLRQARPEMSEDLADPQSPPNQAILQAILGVGNDNVDAGVGVDADIAEISEISVDTGTGSRRKPHRLRWRVATVAAAGATVAGLVALSPFGPSEPSAASVVQSAAAASASALDSGRASLTVASGGVEDTYEYRFAGEDVGVVMTLGSESGEAYPSERRIVDGEMYWHVGDDPSTAWFHLTGAVPSRSDWSGDPRSLLAGLEPRAGFEVVGDDTVDGVDVTRLRATTPGNVDASELSLGEATMGTGTLTALDVWVDGDDIVRRIDIEITQTIDFLDGDGNELAPPVTQVITASVRFSHIGEPNTIEPPTNVRDVSVEEMANPVPPPAGTPGG